MRTNFTKQTLLFFSFLILHFSLSAQQWRWGKKGGSADDQGGGYERLQDMAVDANGNIYVISTVGYGGMNVNNTPRTGWGAEDVMLASFTCDGTLRWSKIIGGGRSDYAWSVKTDKKDGVYFALSILFYSGGTVTGHVDGDATIPSNNKTFYLMKYDTAGTFQWYRAPQPDTVTSASYSYTGVNAMDVDDHGNVNMFCVLPKGEFGGPGGFVSNSLGNYILKYDASGSFLGGFKMDCDIQGTAGNNMSMKRNSNNGNYYIAGIIGASDQVSMGGTVLSGAGYLSCFNASGQVLWYKESTGDAGATSGFDFDKNNNIFISGYAGQNGSFAGHPLTGTSVSQPFVMMLREDGSVVWASQASNGTAQNVGTCVAVRNSGEIVIGGFYAGVLSWGNVAATAAAGDYSLFTARFAKNGKILELNNLQSTNGVFAEKMISDGRDNIFVGGSFSGELQINSNSLYTTGGEADWWVAKYGYDCNCTDIPEPNFSFTRNGYDLGFNYTGSNNYTSIEWDFGDGTTATGASVSHTYPANSYQTACVKVANDCGDNIYCENIPLWPTNITNISSDDGIRIYPNPASDVLNIEGIDEGTRFQLFDVTGRTVYQATSSESKATINITELPSGNYVVQLTDKNGRRVMKKLVKE